METWVRVGQLLSLLLAQPLPSSNWLTILPSPNCQQVKKSENRKSSKFLIDIFLVQGTKPTDQIQSWKEIKTLDSTITVPTNPLKKINLAKMHSMGRVLAEPNEKSDDPWELDTSQRTIVLNEIKRKGAMGVDKGNLNTPIDGRCYYTG